MPDETITVTLLREDAIALCLGGLDYAVKVMAGEEAGGGSPMRARQELARKLRYVTADD